MRQFLRHLKAAWLYSRYFPYIEGADEEGFWTPADETSLASFLRSHTGSKLRHRLSNYYIQMAQSAVMNPDTPAYKMGVAAGIHMTISAIESHFPGGIPTDAESEQLEGQAALDRLETETA